MSPGGIVGKVGADEAKDIAAQWRMSVTKELFQGGAVAGMDEEHEEGLVGKCGPRHVG